MTSKAVILAAGRGTRMRGGPFPSDLTTAQRKAATRGLKAMIPFGEESQPFLAHILNGLGAAGIRQVCLVLSPDQHEVREYLRRTIWSRVRAEEAVQEQPLGTAHAVLQAESFAAGESVVVINGDNLYPTRALTDLAALPRAGLIGFRKSHLIREGNIPPERINAFALIEVDGSGVLTRIIEKPAPLEAAPFGADPLVSMNAWLLPPTIYSACRAVSPSPRGELELQDAVRYAMERLNERFVVVESREGVLDLSTANDIPAVQARLRGAEVRL